MRNLQETKIQGTPMHPLMLYRMHTDAGKIDVTYHWQETVELIHVIRGEVELHICECDYIAKPGDIFYINPYELHGMRSRTADCFYTAFVFPLSWLEFSGEDEALVRYLRPLMQHHAVVQNRLPCEILPEAACLLHEISSLYAESENGAWLGIKADLLRLYYLMYRTGAVVFHPQQDPSGSLLLEIPRYIRAHSSEKLTLARMGEAFHFSPKYFSLYFQKHFGRSFADYLTSVRIEQAKVLLLETESSLELIAQQTGFSQSGYMIRVFRTHQGITPAQYRRLCRKNGAGA